MATLHCISGVGDKAAACFVVEGDDGRRVMFDLGAGPAKGQRPPVDDVGPVEAIVLSHQHPDHKGGLDIAHKVGDPPVYGTPPALEGLRRALPAHPLPWHGGTTIGGLPVTVGRAGHSPGGVWLHVDVGGGLLYMGDDDPYSPLYHVDPPPAAETIIVDVSYGADDEPRDTQIAAFDPWFDAAERDGLLIPTPVHGRGPEIALHLMEKGYPAPRLDADHLTLIDRLLTDWHPAVRPHRLSALRRLREQARAPGPVEGVTLAGTANADGGTSGDLVAQYRDSDRPAILMTGYIPSGTVPDTLLKEGRAHWLRWPVHRMLSDNAALVRQAGAMRVIPAFGVADATALAAWERTFAPAGVVLDNVLTL